MRKWFVLDLKTNKTYELKNSYWRKYDFPLEGTTLKSDGYYDYPRNRKEASIAAKHFMSGLAESGPSFVHNHPYRIFSREL